MRTHTHLCPYIESDGPEAALAPVREDDNIVPFSPSTRDLPEKIDSFSFTKFAGTYFQVCRGY